MKNKKRQTSDLQSYMKMTLKIISLPGGYQYQEARPRIYCKDGFNLSVQGGRSLYSEPQQDGVTNFENVEVGFPSEKVDELMPYVEDERNPTETIYSYVPIEIVEAIIEKHGGIE